LQRYEEEFVDRVVIHFAEQKVEGFNIMRLWSDRCLNWRNKPIEKDDRASSYETLKQLFQDKAQEGCDRVSSQLKKLEQDLTFLSIGGDKFSTN